MPVNKLTISDVDLVTNLVASFSNILSKLDEGESLPFQLTDFSVLCSADYVADSESMHTAFIIDRSYPSYSSLSQKFDSSINFSSVVLGGTSAYPNLPSILSFYQSSFIVRLASHSQSAPIP
jgi:hypothetical protein